MSTQYTLHLLVFLMLVFALLGTILGHSLLMLGSELLQGINSGCEIQIVVLLPCSAQPISFQGSVCKCLLRFQMFLGATEALFVHCNSYFSRMVIFTKREGSWQSILDLRKSKLGIQKFQFRGIGRKCFSWQEGNQLVCEASWICWMWLFVVIIWVQQQLIPVYM